MERLKEYRLEINAIDASLLELLERRLELALAIGQVKAENNLPILDASREKEVLARNLKALKRKDFQTEAIDFFTLIMDLGKRVQKGKEKTAKKGAEK